MQGCIREGEEKPDPELFTLVRVAVKYGYGRGDRIGGETRDDYVVGREREKLKYSSRIIQNGANPSAVCFVRLVFYLYLDATSFSNGLHL